MAQGVSRAVGKGFHQMIPPPGWGQQRYVDDIDPLCKSAPSNPAMLIEKTCSTQLLGGLQHHLVSGRYHPVGKTSKPPIDFLSPRLLAHQSVGKRLHHCARTLAMPVEASKVAVPALVTPAWLKERVEDTSVSILDASWYMPNAGRNPAKEFKQERIPGSKFFDIDKISDTSSELPHMLPSAASFAAAADALGVTNDSTVVLYDRAGIFSAPRAWWTCKAFGHDKVAVLDGGYPAWQSAGYEVDTASTDEQALTAGASAAQNPPVTTSYKAQYQPQLVRELQQVLENIDRQMEAVVDARGASRFTGSAAEPRKGVRGGHIPGSVNVPFDSLLENGRYKDVEQLRQVFSQAGIDWKRPIVTSCGTGVTASVLALGLYLIDPQHPVAVYDGSWTEWGSRSNTPVSIGS